MSQAAVECEEFLVATATRGFELRRSGSRLLQVTDSCNRNPYPVRVPTTCTNAAMDTVSVKSSRDL